MNSIKDNKGKSHVEISINDVTKEIHRGNRTVVEIKTIGGVPLNHMLEQLIEDVLTPLDDNASVVIKGGEVFISHPKDGGSA